MILDCKDKGRSNTLQSVVIESKKYIGLLNFRINYP